MSLLSPFHLEKSQHTEYLLIFFYPRKLTNVTIYYAQHESFEALANRYQLGPSEIQIGLVHMDKLLRGFSLFKAW